MCLHDYAVQFSLKKAAAMLADTTLSVSDICLQLGFSNRTYFYKLFYERYHMTPKEYRKNSV